MRWAEWFLSYHANEKRQRWLPLQQQSRWRPMHETKVSPPNCRVEIQWGVVRVNNVLIPWTTHSPVVQRDKEFFNESTEQYHILLNKRSLSEDRHPAGARELRGTVRMFLSHILLIFHVFFGVLPSKLGCGLSERAEENVYIQSWINAPCAQTDIQRLGGTTNVFQPFLPILTHFHLLWGIQSIKPWSGDVRKSWGASIQVGVHIHQYTVFKQEHLFSTIW